MKLIKDDQANITQLRILLETATENPLSDHFHLGSGRDSTVKADLIAHSIPDLFLAKLAHILRCQPGRNPPGFEEEDFSP